MSQASFGYKGKFYFLNFWGKKKRWMGACKTTCCYSSSSVTVLAPVSRCRTLHRSQEPSAPARAPRDRTGCCSHPSAHGGRTGSAMSTPVRFTASRAPALCRTHVRFLLAAQLSDCYLHISGRCSIIDLTGKGVWNNWTVWEPHSAKG